MKARYESLPMSASPIRVKEYKNHVSRNHVHWHEEIEILYFTQGESSVSCDLKEVKVKKGDIVFINGKELHSGTIRGYGSAYFCIQVNTEFFHNLIGNEYVIFENLISDGECSAMLERIVDMSLCENFKSTIALKKALYEFFALLTDRHVSSVLNENDYKKQFKRLDTFNSIVEYINKHYSEDINVTSIANQFFISPSYFAHLFKEKSGKSVIEYINEVRITRAKSFLEKEDISVGSIALLVGFGDINYFSRKFKELVGKTPREYKKSLADN